MELEKTYQIEIANLTAELKDKELNQTQMKQENLQLKNDLIQLQNQVKQLNQQHVTQIKQINEKNFQQIKLEQIQFENLKKILNMKKKIST